MRIRPEIQDFSLEQYRSHAAPDPINEPEQGGSRRFFTEFLETILISVLLFAGINAVSARIRVESVSMLPTLTEGDFVFVNKLAYRLGEPQRGDVIVFRYPPDPENEPPYIKRVIGLPGDHLSIDQGQVYVNGELLQEPYLNEAINWRDGAWQVPEGALFVMGDNRNNSSDSRSWGTVPLENVIGRAVIIYWPPEEWAVMHFRTAVAAEAQK